MSTNNFRLHVQVLPEDRANAEFATGFFLETGAPYQAIQILNEAGGWIPVLEKFQSIHVPRMQRFPMRLMILLIDLDGNIDRLKQAKAKIPSALEDRVFVLGVLSNPELLQTSLNHTSREQIGRTLAEGCRTGSNELWGHALLKHNLSEVARMRDLMIPILFQ